MQCNTPNLFKPKQKPRSHQNKYLKKSHLLGAIHHLLCSERR